MGTIVMIQNHKHHQNRKYTDAEFQVSPLFFARGISNTWR